MRKASRRLTQLYDDALAPCGLRSTQFAILCELAPRAKTPPTLQELADALVLDRSALGHNLKPLERDGLVGQQASAEDARRRLIVMTPEGKKAFRRAEKLWRLAQDQFLLAFGEQPAMDLRLTLLKIANDDRLISAK